MTPEEVQALLAELGRSLDADLVALWGAALDEDTFRRFVIDAFPELVLPYAEAAAEIGADWYDSAPTTTTGFVPVTAALPSVERLTTSAEWALNTGRGLKALTLMQGSAQRAVADGARDTVIENVGREQGARWARHASANACAFCRMLATRTGSGKGALYTSEAAATTVGGRGKDVATNFTADGRRKRGGQAKGVKARGTQALGDKFHDHCHCVAVMIRPGQTYEPAPYVAEWREQYNQARKDAGSSDANAIVNAWQRALNA